MAAIASAEPEGAAGLAYVAVYACGYRGGVRLDACRRAAGASFDGAFVARLIELVSDERVLEGWRLTSSDRQQVLLEKDGVRAATARWRVEHSRDGIGDEMSLRMPAVVPGEMPGFVTRYGLVTPPDRPLSRLYLSIRSSHAKWVLGPLSRALDAAGFPYVLKVLAHPRAYVRRDACVVYILTDHAARAVDLVRRCITADSIHLRASVPLLTRRLATGIGFADDPSASGMGPYSHGEWVTGLFVRAARDTFDPAVIARRVMEEIAASGRDPDRPYLRPKRTSRDLEISR